MPTERKRGERGKAKCHTVYAIYKGEINIADGTAAELARRLNKSQGYIRMLASSRMRKRAEQNPNRLIAIKIGYTTDEL
ncbi:hypothetical protein [Avibacterium paragallinarum]|uniref:Uncharacterized protein n=1 Tax=Avibacterium paragallinarum TaxID=728 RepID=A0A8B3T971_AVIPA|nr:hypothetical protein [Avibacterium paragallinarum]RZN60786.1 hypothetical protein EIG79_02540 [Avibacterium paragallinarum]